MDRIIMDGTRIGNNTAMQKISSCLEKQSNPDDELIKFTDATEEIGIETAMDCREQEIFATVVDRLNRINSRGVEFFQAKELERLYDYAERECSKIENGHMLLEDLRDYISFYFQSVNKSQSLK